MEFALLAPLGFLLLIGIIVIGIVITNYIQLTNMAREGARIAAICGSNTSSPMPDGSGQTCSDANVASYITSHLVAVPAGSVSPQIFVCAADAAGNCAGSKDCTGTNCGIENCQPGRIVEVDMAYDQPLYLPLVSNVFQTNSNGTRHLTAAAQATCEQ